VFTEEELAMIYGQRDAFLKLFQHPSAEAQMEAERKIDAVEIGLNAQAKRTQICSWPERF
jgi:hypothetical protein